MVSRLLLRGLTQREIQDALSQDPKMLNGRGQPWSLATVNRDVKAVKLAWQRQYATDYQHHAARMLSEYREVRREAWRQGDLDLVMKCCQMECKLLGLDEPEKLAIVDWRREAEDAGYDAGAIFDELVAHAAASLAESSDS